jgi:N-formylglutamate amidohydrolase
LNKRAIVFHIPHASTSFPSLEAYVNLDLIPGEVEKLTDWHTDKIFAVPGITTLRAGFSRVFCDVERFVPDELEPMATHGMGFYYTHTDDGRRLRDETEYKEKVKRDYYDPHHRTLAAMLDERLESEMQCCLVDCHSFSDKPAIRENDQNADRPDICIGTDPFHTPWQLSDAIFKVYRRAGYEVRENRPFSGTMVPAPHFKRERRVMSVMIEINRRLYLKAGGVMPGAIEKLQALVVKVVESIQAVEC